MRSLKTALAAATLGLTLVASPAFAREDMDANLFVKMAADSKDGMVSKEEVMKHVEKMFDQADTRKMGKLDKKQVETFLRELMKSGA